MESLTRAAAAFRGADPLGSTFGPTPTPTYAESTGVSANSPEDLAAFLSALGFNLAVCSGSLVLFSYLRLRVKRIYADNVDSGVVPDTGPCFLGWIRTSWTISTEDITRTVGLDSALMLEFCDLCIWVLSLLSVPLVAGLAPLHLFAGGQAKPSENLLGSIEMSSVARDHVWMYYIHAATVWAVVLLVRWSVYRAQARFLELRFEWLKLLPRPRATTILVEHIPKKYQSDDCLREFFGAVFSPEAIKEVHVVRQCTTLTKLAAKWVKTLEQKRRAEVAAAAAAQDLNLKSPHMRWTLSRKVETLKTLVEALESQISEEQELLRQRALEPAGVNAHSAFVTFSNRQETEMALNLRYSADQLQWVVSVPPEPATLRWGDLARRPELQGARNALAYALIFTLYIFCMPICAYISTLASTVQAGPAQAVWAGLVPTIGLQLMMGFLPTILLSIFRLLFALKADPWAQVCLQNWYFVFQVIFVILVTAVGASLAGTLDKLMNQPSLIFSLLASQLPGATHFYMNYLVLQWAAHGMASLRYMNLIKFFAFKFFRSDDEAKTLAEPEDQDSNGMGARYSRLTIHMLIGIIFSTISPMVAPLALISFVICRVVYAYLIVYAEALKPDLGGVFWVKALEHLQIGTMIYCVLMIGMLWSKGAHYDWGANSFYPAVLASPSLLFAAWSYRRFSSAFDWKKLPMDRLLSPIDEEEIVDTCENYIQPELLPVGQEAIAAAATAARTPRHTESVLQTPRVVDIELVTSVTPHGSLLLCGC